MRNAGFVFVPFQSDEETEGRNASGEVPRSKSPSPRKNSPRKKLPSEPVRNATEEAASHEMSDSEGEEEESGVGGADGRVKFPTLVTKSDFEDSEDMAAGRRRGQCAFVTMWLVLQYSSCYYVWYARMVALVGYAIS